MRKTRAFGVLVTVFVALGMAGLASRAEAAGALTLSPSSGAPGVSVSVKGTGFPKKTTGALTFGTTTMASVKTNSSGVFNASFKVPSAPAGTVSVTATVGTASSTAAFTVTGSATTTTAPPTTTTTVPTTTPGFVTRSGRQLLLNGAPWRFTGFNAPDLSTDYGINYGCGENNTSADLDTFFGSLRPNSLVRVWAFQSIAYNKNTQTVDFAVIDRVVNKAAQYNQKLVLVLSHQWGGGCGEVFKTESWFASGYKNVVTDGTQQGAQTNPLSFYDWVSKIGARYANSPSVAMWEPVNEPYPTVSNGGACSSSAANSLKNFFNTIGGRLHQLAPKQLVASGVQGSGQCGTAGTEYESLHQSGGIDVATVHDYYAPTEAMGGDQWNGLQVRVNQMAKVNKPLFLEESGINASTTGPITFDLRRTYFKAKMDAQLGAGMVGYLPWTWSKVQDASNYHIAPGDPMLALIHDYAL